MQILRFTAPIVRIDNEQRVVKGPLLRPYIVDRANTWFSPETIRNACYDFMVRLAAGETGSGLMHNDFEDRHTRFQVVECYITTVDEVVPKDQKLLVEGDTTEGDVEIPAGSWMFAVRVLDDEAWGMVKRGTLRGFSIGGSGRTRYAASADVIDLNPSAPAELPLDAGWDEDELEAAA